MLKVASSIVSSATKKSHSQLRDKSENFVPPREKTFEQQIAMMYKKVSIFSWYTPLNAQPGIVSAQHDQV